MTTRGGIWILRPTGNLEQITEDPGSDYYLDPRPMNEQAPTEAAEFKNVADAYTRHAVKEGDNVIGYCYAQSALGANDMLRVINAIHSSYVRD